MASHGDRAALGRQIIRCEVGSRAHGLATEASDRDLMGVYIETPEQVLGLAKSHEHLVQRDQPDGVRSGPGDTDLTLYSLRKYLQLATAGNPTVLVLLYADQPELCTEWGAALVGMRDAIVSEVAVRKFLGYLRGQKERMLGGGRQSRVPNRPELIERHGYDTKYAGHALRLGLQGIELASTGQLTLPMEGTYSGLVMKVRRGDVPFERACQYIDHAEDLLARAVEAPTGALRPEPDLARINRFMASAQTKFWRQRGEF